MTAVIIASLTYVVFKKRILHFLKENNLTVKNYKGNEVYTGGGLLLMFPCIFAIISIMLYRFNYSLVLYILVVAVLPLSGILDDVLGDSRTKGLKGHIKAFIKGGFSTGALKALMGTGIGFLAAFAQYNNLFILILDTITFALCINFINLLDLRPGRAIKGFSAIMFILVVISGFQGLWMVLPLITALCLYLKGEMTEEYMLGDTGANLIGGLLGLYAVTISALTVRLVLTALLLLIHVFTEFFSISQWIEGVPLLKFIDQIGRRREGNEAK